MFDPYITFMLRTHELAVLDIDRASFVEPLSEERLVDLRRQSGMASYVALVEEHVAGFVLYRMCPPAVSIQRFAVRPAFRRQGVALLLLARVMRRLQFDPKRLDAAPERIDVTVPETHTPAQILLRRCGFKAERMMRGADVIRFSLTSEACCRPTAVMKT